MDVIKVTAGKNHHSDEIMVEIQPFGVEPEPEPTPVAAGLGLLLLGGLLLFAVTRKKGEKK